MANINKYSTVPLYHQLKTVIKLKIESGEYAADTQIPSEQDLCQEFDISRPTVRQAINELTASGHLYKLKGKGTFVAKRKSLINIKDYNGFTDSILDCKNPASNKFISLDKVTNRSNPKLNEIFGLRLDSIVEFAYIVWTGVYNEEVVSLNESWIPLVLFPEIIDDLLKKKTSQEMLKGKYPYLPYHANSVLDIIYTDSQEASEILIQPGQALIRVKNTLKSRDGTVVECIVTKYRADKCMLAFENHR